MVPSGRRAGVRGEGKDMSEILVSGGNGFVGRHVVLALRERGETVRVLALPDEDMVVVFNAWNILPGKPRLPLRPIVTRLLNAVMDTKVSQGGRSG